MRRDLYFLSPANAEWKYLIYFDGLEAKMFVNRILVRIQRRQCPPLLFYEYGCLLEGYLQLSQKPFLFSSIF